MGPKEVKRLGTEGLQITWMDGTSQTFSSEELRQNCPSATSRAERGDISHEKPLTVGKKSSLAIVQHSKAEQIALERVSAVGNYAIRLHWADGHDSGIYSFEYLKTLSSK
ncbi:MAG: DUF971 domain-containing protein [Bdellovibrionales bacterium]|nr:DUF971 domain-containing protein [Bdellovibrionales bacterium]